MAASQLDVSTTEATKSALWEEDSPYFRDSAHESIGQMKVLSSSVKELIKGMKDLCKATIAMGQASRAMARANHTAASNLSATLETDKDMQPLLCRFGSTLEEIAHAQETLAHSLTQSFVLPLEDFCTKEMDKVPDLERAYSHGRGEFVEALGRFLHSSTVAKTSNKGQPVTNILTPRALELAHERRAYEDCRQRLASKVDELETRRTLELTESIAACLFALHSFHHQSMDLVSTLNPCMEDLRLAQTRARASLQRSQGQWDRRREMLDMLLPHDVVERMLDPSEEAKLSRPEGATSPTLVGPSSSPSMSALYELYEKKYGILDVQASLRAFFHPREAPDVHWQSYLFWRTPGKLMNAHTWVRRWFVLEGSKLYYIREAGDKEEGGVEGGEERCLVCDVVLSTVRELVTADQPFCFEVLSANRKSYLLQAEGPHDYHAWIHAIRRRIERLLIGDDSKKSDGACPRHADAANAHDRSPPRSPSTLPSSSSSSSSYDGPLSPSLRSPNGAASSDAPVTGDGPLARDPGLRALCEANGACVDCNSPGPDWVSINLGVFMCIGCSGIHRSLGVHISKVRSITLDTLDPLDLGVLRRVGNDRANVVWEHKLLDGWTKPLPADTRAVKENYIRAKYTWRGFIEIDDPSPVPSGVAPPDFYARQLVDAVLRDDLEGVSKALLKGADLKWKGEEGHTALHTAAREGRGEIVAFLFQNGADVSARDAKNLLPADLAKANGHADVARYLLK